jgi:hypothetical protein
MARPPPEQLEAFLARQDVPALVSVLMELAAEHDAVNTRLVRMQLADRPDKLAAAFRKSLAAWRRSSKWIGYSEAPRFARSLEVWLEEVEREMLPKDPAAAVALYESFIETDVVFFERADDSGGAIGDLVRTACQFWLRAAARCGSPPAAWQERLVQLVDGDDYGAREELLRHADLLLDEGGLRDLANLYEARMASALASPSTSAGLPHEVFKTSAALSLLAEALRDPDIKVRAVLSYSPQPNALQQQSFVDAYLKADRPADALGWLQETWGHLESNRQRLLAEVLGRLGRHHESAPIRQALFEQTLSAFDLHRWLEHLPETSRPEVLARARQLALNHDDPAAAAALLLDIGDDEAADAMLASEPAHIHGDSYTSLVPLAKALHARGRSRGETAIYRALLAEILDRTYARAYNHAARYWLRLESIAATGVDLRPLEPHEAFEMKIRSLHARKSAFWAKLKQSR